MICAVVVTYHPDLYSLEQLLDRTYPQVSQLVLVDNGSGEQAQHDLARLIATAPISIARFAPQPSNLGIGAAQNIGIALADACTHVLLLDQDSQPEPDMVNELLAASTQRAENRPIAAAGAAVIESKIARRPYFVTLGRWRYSRTLVNPADSPVRADILIASGCLIPQTALDDLGLMDESLFIDRVDTEWCLRAIASGYRCIGVPRAHLQHSIGSNTIRLAPFQRRVVLHDTRRHYYAFRNSVLLLKRRYVPWRWRVNESVLLVQMALVYLVYAPERRRRLAAMARGIVHGLAGRSGPLR